MNTSSSLYTQNGKLYTKNLTPGKTVYGEKLITIAGHEYRSWNPYRSKLAATILKSHLHPSITSRSRILYLGAANGTTVSHLSDLVYDGIIYALDISPRAMQDLLSVSTQRDNIIPLLADAKRPDDYRTPIEDIDLVYQDIAQRDQVDIFRKNLTAFLCTQGILMVKARSIDVSQPPKKIFSMVQKQITKDIGGIATAVPLDPFEKDHLAIYL